MAKWKEVIELNDPKWKNLKYAALWIFLFIVMFWLGAGSYNTFTGGIFD
jgi:hypothetical protein